LSVPSEFLAPKELFDRISLENNLENPFELNLDLVRKLVEGFFDSVEDLLVLFL
jgi:hypothetical protein